MMLRRTALLAPMLLAACGQEAPSAPAATAPETAAEPVAASPNAAAPAGSTPITAVGDLLGEYRVAGVDGASIDLPYGISASISENRIHVVADCVNLAWDYRFAGAALVTERVAVEGCARGLTPQEEAIVAAFEAANGVGRTPANGIEFSGGGHSVLLFRQ